MIYLGVIVAACALMVGIALYMDTYFIGDVHKDHIRTNLIKLFNWIDDIHASHFLLTLWQMLSGWIATAIYFILSVVYLGYDLYLLALDVKKDVTDAPLPPEYNVFQELLTKHYLDIVYVMILLLIPNTILITLLVKAFVGTLKTKRKIRVDCIFILLFYFLFVTIGAEYVVDIIDNAEPGLIGRNHIALAGLLAAIGSFLDALDILEDLWVIIFFPAIAIVIVSVASLAFFYVFRFTKWFAAKFLGVASDVNKSPYTFLATTLGIIVSFLALVDEIRKLRHGS